MTTQLFDKVFSTVFAKDWLKGMTLELRDTDTDKVKKWQSDMGRQIKYEV
jgi:hypothetical protein